MQDSVFREEITKIRDMWPNSFNDTRIKVIWEIVRKESDQWFKNACRSFLVHGTKAPLPADFLELVRLEDKNRVVNAGFASPSEMSPMEGSIFSKEDIAEICGMIQKCMNGEISGAELREFGKMVDAAVKSKKPLGCTKCSEGSVFARDRKTNYEYVFKCDCPKGQRNQLNHPLWMRELEFQYSLGG